MRFEIFCWQDCIHIFTKGNYSGKGHNPAEKKICVSYFFFFMRNPNKKFQNSSMHVSKVLCYASNRKKEQMDGQTPQKQYAPPTSKLGA